MFPWQTGATLLWGLHGGPQEGRGLWGPAAEKEMLVASGWVGELRSPCPGPWVWGISMGWPLGITSPAGGRELEGGLPGRPWPCWELGGEWAQLRPSMEREQDHGPCSQILLRHRGWVGELGGCLSRGPELEGLPEAEAQWVGGPVPSLTGR